MINADQAAFRSRNETARQYENYYGTGYYDRRYPRPNAHVLGVLHRHLPEGGTLLDFGCGNGRYLGRLAARCSEAIGFEICDTALVALRDRSFVTASGAQVQICGPDRAELKSRIEFSGKVDVAACLFGVLSHIDTGADRRAVLELLRESVHTDTGKVIVSVPNRFRRFPGEQRSQKAGSTGEISYTRLFEGGKVELFYKLFDPASFVQELEQSGLTVEYLTAESLFPESWNSRFGACRAVEQFVAPVLPPIAGYGMIAVARPKR